ncbi:TetR/AcrR family transcriptional regulator [Geodermatophilus aquaeductus]|uniref:Transcriptional regulator, TetR family n=1 Tax=Geodermatophilus aquaeductus TaxID=1564161 RepID=A0A521CUA6_9ACTN|nr:TetR/AcrR family transcriptional regulator [Geodermatophilus aquaeductus]SMO62311.1 transcriptional regulator, TetR family [Geodermatophilus aquaeductus]
MPRPRVHSPDAVLDAAEDLLVEHGRAQLTIRALAERSGASNGSVYHAFGSLETVVAAAWLRRARSFLTLQRAAVDEALAAGDVRRAVQAAADAPARLADDDLRAARLLVSLQRDDLLTGAVAPAVAQDLRALDATLATTLRDLAHAVWDRGDAAAVDGVTACVVRLPAALLFGEIRAGRVRAHTRARLTAAVGAVLDCGPPS